MTGANGIPEHHSGIDPWNPRYGWRPIVVRKRWVNWHRPRWEVRFHGKLRAVHDTGALALADVHRYLTTVNPDRHNTPEDPT